MSVRCSPGPSETTLAFSMFRAPSYQKSSNTSGSVIRTWKSPWGSAFDGARSRRRARDRLGLRPARRRRLRHARPPETRWGILAGAGGTQRLARLIGPGAAKLLMYTARPVSATEALRLGLVNQISSNDDPLEDAQTLATVIADNSPRAIQSVKCCVDEGLDLPLTEALRLERELWIDLISDGDLQEGAAAFFDRRPPRYPNWPTN